MIYRFNSIGNCCREWRKDKNISIEEMASRNGCTTQNITAFERGENVSGKILLSYIREGLAVVGFDDDLFICKDVRGNYEN